VSWVWYLSVSRSSWSPDPTVTTLPTYPREITSFTTLLCLCHRGDSNPGLYDKAPSNGLSVGDVHHYTKSSEPKHFSDLVLISGQSIQNTRHRGPGYEIYLFRSHSDLVFWIDSPDISTKFESYLLVTVIYNVLDI
jgi:hypothetical protein